MTLALWLIPGEPARSAIAAIIDRLSAEYGSPRFEPHMTLLHPLPAGDGAGNLQSLAPHLTGLDLIPAEVTAGEDYFHCVFLKLLSSERLQRARTAAEEVFPGSQQALVPHISLLYAEMSREERAALVARVPPYPRDPIPVAAMEIVDVSGPVSGWRSVARVRR